MGKSPLAISVGFLTDFIISAGGCFTTAMVATGTTTTPSWSVMIFSVVTGLVAAARRVQAVLDSDQVPLSTVKTVETDPTGAKREVTTSAPTPPPPKATP